MFNPTVTVDLDSILDSLGSFYTDFDDASKNRIKNYWTSMIESVGGLYYDLYQNHLSKYLYYTQGYIENKFREFKVVFEGDNKNVEFLQFSPPSGLSISNTPSIDNEAYAYSVSCVTDYGETLASNPIPLISGSSTLSSSPNTLQWHTVSGIDTYNIYGRDASDHGYLHQVSGITHVEGVLTTFIDSGIYVASGTVPTTNTATWGYNYTIPDDFHYFTIPTLSGVAEQQLLTESVDYEIEDLRKIKFLKPATAGIQDGYIAYDSTNMAYEVSETFVASNSICLIPILASIYFKGFGIDDPAEITNSSLYYPYISGLDSLTYYEQQTSYAKHLYHWTYAMSYVLRQPPTINNVKHGLGLVLNVPFNYYSGTVISVADDTNFKYINISGTEGSYIYKVASSLDLNYSAGETVDRFALLTDGTYVTDYIEDSVLVSGHTLKHGEITEYDLFTDEFSPDDNKFKVMESFATDVTKAKTSDPVTFEV